MGLESYLFQIELDNAVDESKIIDLFKQVGMACLPTSKIKNPLTDYRSYYFELRTQNGLTEANVLFAPKETSTTEFSFRFSVLSPKAIIEQTFNILSILNSVNPIKVYDTEISNHIYRQLRKDGEVDKDFGGIENTEKENDIMQKCYIPIDINEFIKNELNIYKRQLIISNEYGEVIEGGEKTIEFIEKKGLLDRFIYWVKSEL
jgi:hypothetical protein